MALRSSRVGQPTVTLRLIPRWQSLMLLELMSVWTSTSTQVEVTALRFTTPTFPRTARSSHSLLLTQPSLSVRTQEVLRRELMMTAQTISA